MEPQESKTQKRSIMPRDPNGIRPGTGIAGNFPSVPELFGILPAVHAPGSRRHHLTR